MATNDRHRPPAGQHTLHLRRLQKVTPIPRRFLRNKRQEWEEYRSQVTAFELRKSLPVL